MITNGYATLAEIRPRLGFVTVDNADDTMLEGIVMAVSRWIDQYCGRRFFTTSSDETRHYTAEDGGLLFLPDDLISVSTLSTDEDGDRIYERTWASTDYDLEPANAAMDGLPYSRISVPPAGRYRFPWSAKGVKIAGQFGWGTTAPTPIKEACLLQCERLYKRKDAPFGVMGSAEMGQVLVIPKLDPDVAIMLASYVRYSIAGV